MIRCHFNLIQISIFTKHDVWKWIFELVTNLVIIFLNLI